VCRPRNPVFPKNRVSRPKREPWCVFRDTTVIPSGARNLWNTHHETRTTVYTGGDTWLVAVPGLSPEQMQQLEQLAEQGMDPTTVVALSSIPSLLCVMGIGAGLAAIGGAILGAVKPD